MSNAKKAMALMRMGGAFGDCDGIVCWHELSKTFTSILIFSFEVGNSIFGKNYINYYKEQKLLKSIQILSG